MSGASATELRRRRPRGLTKKNWQAFKDSLTTLNTFQGHLVLRKYQADILNTGKFTVLSPFSGRPMTITRSVSLGGHMAYRLPEGENSWLIAGYIRLGFPLHEWITGTHGIRHPLIKIKNTAGKRLQLSQVQSLSSLVDDPDASGTALVIGHENFAHHLWNELAALDHWLQHSTDEQLNRLSIFAIDEPLGPLRELFPRLSTTTIGPASSRDIQTNICKHAIAVRAGSRLVTEQIRKRVRNVSEQKGRLLDTHPARKMIKSAWPRVWVSVRLGSRTADNQDAFLLAFFQTLYASYPNAVVLVDGFSFPVGFFGDARTEERRDKFSQRSSVTNDFITALLQQARERLGDKLASRIVSISGIELHDAIRFGAHCDYYVCHVGTLQHKIAWLHNIPGMLHSPHPKKGHAIWHGAQVENGILPDIIPARFVGSSASSRMRARGRNFDYAFTDPEQSARYILDVMKSHFGAIRPEILSSDAISSGLESSLLPAGGRAHCAGSHETIL